VHRRIYLGFAALVVLSLGIAVFGVIQFAGIGGDVGRMDILAGNTQRLLTVSRQLEANASGGDKLLDRRTRSRHERCEG
jgi:hypothetical protein